MSGARTKIKTGTLVRYRTEFLRGIGWSTDIPINGIVIGMKGPHLARVWWCDAETGEASSVNTANLEIDKKGESLITDNYRAALLDEWRRVSDLEFVTG